MSPLQFWLSALLFSHLNFNSCFFLALSTVLFLPRAFLVWHACFILPFLHLRSFLCSKRCLAAQSTMNHFESFLFLTLSCNCRLLGPALICGGTLVTYSRLLFATLSVCLLRNVLAALLLCGWVVRMPLLSAMLDFVLCFLPLFQWYFSICHRYVALASESKQVPLSLSQKIQGSKHKEKQNRACEALATSTSGKKTYKGFFTILPPVILFYLCLVEPRNLFNLPGTAASSFFSAEIQTD